MKQPITEEMHLEEEWFKQARQVKSVEELSQFVDKMLNSYEHDYGTACHAIAACALASTWLGSHIEGITGFQAGFVMWDFIRHWVKEGNKCGMKLVDYDDFLFPQYEDKFGKTISEETWESIQEAAKNNLENDDGFVCGAVRQHWKGIVDGVVPFGYKVGKVW